MQRFRNIVFIMTLMLLTSVAYGKPWFKYTTENGDTLYGDALSQSRLIALKSKYGENKFSTIESINEYLIGVGQNRENEFSEEKVNSGAKMNTQTHQSQAAAIGSVPNTGNWPPSGQSKKREREEGESNCKDLTGGGVLGLKNFLPFLDSEFSKLQYPDVISDKSNIRSEAEISSSNCNKFNDKKTILNELKNWEKRAESAHLLIVYKLSNSIFNISNIRKVCNKDGELITIALLNDKNKNEIDYLVSNPSKGRVGGGTAMMCELFKESNGNEISLNSLPSAMPFYEKNGFKRIPGSLSLMKITKEEIQNRLSNECAN